MKNGPNDFRNAASLKGLIQSAAAEQCRWSAEAPQMSEFTVQYNTPVNFLSYKFLPDHFDKQDVSDQKMTMVLLPKGVGRSIWLWSYSNNFPIVIKLSIGISDRWV